MKKLVALTLIMSTAVFLLFSAGGCFNAGQKIAEENIEKSIEEGIADEGGEADVDISEGQINIKTDEGEATIGQGAELPEGFPQAVPVYPDMEITSSWKSVEEGKDAFSVNGLTGDSGTAVFDWYKSQLGGWNIENELSSQSGGENFYSISASNDMYGLIVWITESDEGTIVSITAAGL